MHTEERAVDTAGAAGSAAGAYEQAREEREARRQAAWRRFFAAHPEVLASYAHQNGGWPAAEDGCDWTRDA